MYIGKTLHLWPLNYLLKEVFPQRLWMASGHRDQKLPCLRPRRFAPGPYALTAPLSPKDMWLLTKHLAPPIIKLRV